MVFEGQNPGRMKEDELLLVFRFGLRQRPSTPTTISGVTSVKFDQETRQEMSILIIQRINRKEIFGII
jgi:hypothetical protein